MWLFLECNTVWVQPGVVLFLKSSDQMWNQQRVISGGISAPRSKDCIQSYTHYLQCSSFMLLGGGQLKRGILTTVNPGLHQGSCWFLLLGTKGGSREPLLWKTFPEQDHQVLFQELTTLPSSPLVLGIGHERRLHFHAWKGKCMIMHSHLMPITAVMAPEWAWESVQMIEKPLTLTTHQGYLFFLLNC